jgi:hypothetical protein
MKRNKKGIEQMKEDLQINSACNRHIREEWGPSKSSIN